MHIQNWYLPRYVLGQSSKAYVPVFRLSRWDGGIFAGRGPERYCWQTNPSTTSRLRHAINTRWRRCRSDCGNSAFRQPGTNIAKQTCIHCIELQRRLKIDVKSCFHIASILNFIMHTFWDLRFECSNYIQARCHSTIEACMQHGPT